MKLSVVMSKQNNSQFLIEKKQNCLAKIEDKQKQENSCTVKKEKTDFHFVFFLVLVFRIQKRQWNSN